jgi:hypothetical protein
MGTDDAEPMEEILDINDGVFEDCNRYQTQINEQLKEVGSSHCAQVKGRIDISAQGERKTYTQYTISLTQHQIWQHERKQ